MGLYSAPTFPYNFAELDNDDEFRACMKRNDRPRHYPVNDVTTINPKVVEVSYVDRKSAA